MMNDGVDDALGLIVMLHLPRDVAVALSNKIGLFRLVNLLLFLIGWQSGLRTSVVFTSQNTVGRQEKCCPAVTHDPLAGES